jgi:hypothetical protein
MFPCACISSSPSVVAITFDRATSAIYGRVYIWQWVMRTKYYYHTLIPTTKKNNLIGSPKFTGAYRFTLHTYTHVGIGHSLGYPYP